MEHFLSGNFFWREWNALKQVCGIYVRVDFFFISICMSSSGFSYLHVGFFSVFEKAAWRFACLCLEQVHEEDKTGTIHQTLETKELKNQI